MGVLAVPRLVSPKLGGKGGNLAISPFLRRSAQPQCIAPRPTSHGLPKPKGSLLLSCGEHQNVILFVV